MARGSCKISIATFSILLSACSVLSAGSAEVTIRQVLKSPVYIRGDVNVRIQHSIDTAAWVWMAGHDVWGVSADANVWRVRNGTELYPSDYFRFRNCFVSDGSPLRFDVSADERFVLFLDGEPIARGPQRGTVDHWYFHSYEVSGLEPGSHTIEAVCWQLGVHAPLAQLSYHGGFIFRADGAYDTALTTGKGKWMVARLESTVMTDSGTSSSFGTGSQCRVTGTGFVNECPAESAWKPVVIVRDGVAASGSGTRAKGWMLYPADRPDQVYEVKTPGRIVNVSQDITGAFTVPANTTVDLWWDLDDYYCAYPELKTSGGKDALIKWGWTESLRDKTGKKGNRGEWKKKNFEQTFTDTFICDGRNDAFFTTPWWRCGRWCRVQIKTSDEPLTVHRIAIGETHYPMSVDSSFVCDDPTLAPVLRICGRAMQACMHEMLFDCPYYEQQMYPGDARIQLQILNALTRDDRMAKFVLSIYDFDRRANGMVSMNFPTRGTQESATYTMCWIAMFGDYLMWHDDQDFLRQRMPGVRNALMGLSVYENSDGLLKDLPGWSFMDWVSGEHSFAHGVAPDGDVGQGVSSLNNLLYLMALRSATMVDAALGEEDLARHWRTKAANLGRVLVDKFWDDTRGAMADTVRRDSFSEHAQCMAILGGILTPQQAHSAYVTLVEDKDLALVSSYFAYYLFKAYVQCGRADLVLKRFDYWRNFVAVDARTSFETQDPESTRSDCHAWSACPIYFVHTAFAGVSPSSPFFKTVQVAPQPAGLKNIRARTPCPQGVITTDFHFDGGKVSGTVTLPSGLSGEFVWKEGTMPLVPGVNRIEM